MYWVTIVTISKPKDLIMRLFSLRAQLCACFVLRASQDSRRAPVSRLAPGYSVYRRPRMEANAELV